MAFTEHHKAGFGSAAQTWMNFDIFYVGAQEELSRKYSRPTYLCSILSDDFIYQWCYHFEVPLLVAHSGTGVILVREG